MKIRIKGNSLRYRLTRSDVNAIIKEGRLEERTEFGHQTLVYALQTTTDYDLSATFHENRITLFVPHIMIDQLANTDEVGFESEQGKLFLLVEKDFTCLDNTAEDQSDNYPNPLAEKMK
ncbi:DUF7009 family protein [Mucilaginibacter ginsenosidivorans]|uniref:Uncharacterized protein n=1 Tax=Mucilaginibacter ginsenosidivorans TaxID=398053 RepID=A0A5B8UZE3_9SPHI|nr:hypothetical protein [Mucilaginibacter ginsenosidivorans]QEC64392.1 hypothetical protein FRZ54_18015 [Mucilaginibacter ginsenosidivorans]